MSGHLGGRVILVVGAGTRPSVDPEAPVGNGRAIAMVAAAERRSSPRTSTGSRRSEPPSS